MKSVSRASKWAACMTQLALMGAGLCAQAISVQARAVCTEQSVVTISGSPGITVHDSYSPFLKTDLVESTIVTISNQSETRCDLVVVFTGGDGYGIMHAGAESVRYVLETPNGAPLLNPPSLIDPLSGEHIELTLGPGEVGHLTVRARIGAEQMAAPGNYTDQTPAVRVYHSAPNGSFALLAETSFPISVRVAAVCVMEPPQPATIDFSDDIGADGRPRGIARMIRLPGAACNTTSRLKLSGSPLTHNTGANLAGFDSFINMEAQATFGSVDAWLVTTQAKDKQEATSAPTPGAVSTPVDVTIRLMAGRTLASGDYSGALSITLEPSP